MTVGRLRGSRLAPVGAVLTAGALLAGCGSASSGAASGELELWTHNAGNAEELAVVNQIVEDFNASQDTYTVKVQAFPQAAYNDSVQAAALSKKLPCLLDMDAPIVPNWAWAGFLAPLDLPATMVDKQLPSTLGRYQDKLYSIGYYDAALAIFTRLSTLEDNGIRVPTLDEPWTGEEFDDALAKLKDSGDFDYPLDLGTGDLTGEWWTYAYSPFLQSFGGDLIDRETFTTAENVLNGDPAKEWAAWLQGLVDDGYMPAKSGTDAFADFLNGKSAMVWSGIWNSTNAEQLPDSVALPPPDFGEGPKIGGGSWQWGVSSSCHEKDGAMEYLKFSLNPKYIARFATDLKVIPATEQAAGMSPGWEPGGNNRFFLEVSKRFALIRPPTPAYPYITTTFAKAAQDIVAGADPAETLDQAVKNIDLNLETNDNYGN
jgi:multiple sugar transport system substrate-binding protein